MRFRFLRSVGSAGISRRSFTTQQHMPNCRIVSTKQRHSSEQFQKLTQTTKLKAAVLDWSGTTADKYVFAPAVVFHAIFKKFGVPISMREAREPMGLRKDLHIKAICEMLEVRERWKKVHNAYPTQESVDAMFKQFVPMQLRVLPQYSALIPGTVDAVRELRTQGCAIGSTTGFTREMVDVLLADAIKQGFEPDVTVAGDEVIHGARPAPHMIYRNMDLLGVDLPSELVKVDDTVTGVGEGLSAGCWTAAVYQFSNYVCPDFDNIGQVDLLSGLDLSKLEVASREILMQSGAHYVIPSIKELPMVVQDINKRMQQGERPTDSNHLEPESSASFSP